MRERSNIVMRKVLLYLKLMRVKHYIKNLLIFLPAFFSGDIFQIEAVIRIFWGFLAFSLIASAIYIINDIHDVEKDRQHPVRCCRPIASGRINTRGGGIYGNFAFLPRGSSCNVVWH